MGKLLQGILGGVSGSVGNVTGSSWKGIPVIKAKPLSVANPKTAAQTAQRTKFANSVDFAKGILAEVIKPLWDRFAQKQSGFNAFIKENIDLFEDALPSTPADLVISNGKMAKTDIGSIISTVGSNEVGITWTDDSGEGLKLASDVPFAVVINETTGEVVGKNFDGSSQRDDASVTVSVDALEVGDELECYLAFRRADGTVVSETAHDSETAS